MADTVKDTLDTQSIWYAYCTPQKQKQKQKLYSEQSGKSSELYDQNRRACEKGCVSSTSGQADLPTAPGMNLMCLWLEHKSHCRPISDILTDARSGKLSGITAGQLPDFLISDKCAALAAMRVGISL